MHSYIIVFYSILNFVKKKYLAYNLLSRLALDFRTFLENMKMSSSLSKTLESGIMANFLFILPA